MSKTEVYQQELTKLNEIFKDVEESKRKLVEGLIEDAAFIKAENHFLKEAISKTGMVKVHPNHPELQKPIETAKQYLKNINSYANVVKTLNGVLNKNIIEDEDDLSDFE
jgi:regulator of replication initiation timing